MLLCLAGLPSCSRPSAAGPASQAPAPAVAQRPEVIITPATGAPPATVQVELARTPEEHARGLMFRRQIPEGTGMLFLFPRPEVRRFWMKNTYLPLDMLFLDPHRRVIGIEEQTIPHDETGRGPEQPAQYVIEVPGGYARRHGIGLGSQVEFVHVD